MAEGIRDKVCIVGMGCTKFGEQWDKGFEDLMIESFQEALEDAGIEKKDIQAAWLGTAVDEQAAGKSGMPLGSVLKMPFIPVTRVENFCATGSEALRGAAYAVASGAYDIVLALGVEKLKDAGFGGLPDLGNNFGTKNMILLPNFTAPGAFAQLATAYLAKYKIDPDEGKQTLAKISVKSHHNATLNPRAHLRREITVDDVLKAPIIAWPLGLFDCCGVSDGSAAAIVTTPEIARKLRPDPIYFKAAQIGVSSGEELMSNRWDGAHIETTYRTALRAYQEAHIKNPREELSLIEVHDCFSITELVTLEDLQISPRGRAKEDIDAGFYNIDGQLPCQPDGGLKCFGHPVGASGIRMVYEIYKQLQGKAGPRQIRNPRLGLTHNLGGIPAMCVVSVSIFGN